MKRLNRPDSILVTMSRQNIVEWGGLETIDLFFNITFNESSKADESSWWYKIGPNIPKFEVLYIYFIMHNLIRWRFNFACYMDCKEEGRLLNKNGKPIRMFGNFIVCSGPALKAPEIIPRKGFQGFRYAEIIY